MPARQDRQPFPNRARFSAFPLAHSRLSDCPFLDPPGAISFGPARHEPSGVRSGVGKRPFTRRGPNLRRKIPWASG